MTFTSPNANSPFQKSVLNSEHRVFDRPVMSFVSVFSRSTAERSVHDFTRKNKRGKVKIHLLPNFKYNVMLWSRLISDWVLHSCMTRKFPISKALSSLIWRSETSCHRFLKIPQERIFRNAFRNLWSNTVYIRGLREEFKLQNKSYHL